MSGRHMARSEKFFFKDRHFEVGAEFLDPKSEPVEAMIKMILN